MMDAEDQGERECRARNSFLSKTLMDALRGPSSSLSSPVLLQRRAGLSAPWNGYATHYDSIQHSGIRYVFYIMYKQNLSPWNTGV